MIPKRRYPSDSSVSIVEMLFRLFCSSPFVILLKQLTDHWLSSPFGAANWMDNQWPVGFLRRMTNVDKWGRMKKQNNISTYNARLILHLYWAPMANDVDWRGARSLEGRDEDGGAAEKEWLPTQKRSNKQGEIHHGPNTQETPPALLAIDYTR